jgi:hypothetical protein
MELDDNLTVISTLEAPPLLSLPAGAAFPAGGWGPISWGIGAAVAESNKAAKARRRYFMAMDKQITTKRKYTACLRLGYVE